MLKLFCVMQFVETSLSDHTNDTFEEFGDTIAIFCECKRATKPTHALSLPRLTIILPQFIPQTKRLSWFLIFEIATGLLSRCLS